MSINEELVEQLQREYDRLEREIYAQQGAQRDISAKIDVARLAGRPAFPTEQQREAIKEAGEAIRAQKPASSHHGDGLQGGVASVHPQSGRISVSHHAPYQHRGADRLYRFTEDETLEILGLVEAEGLRITRHWAHDHGLSVLVKPKVSGS